jgi:predicted permease
MNLFITFLIKIFPLFLYVLFGWVMGKILKVKKNDIADVMVFLVLPLITFHGAFTLELSLQTLSLPFLFFIICSLITVLFLFIGKKMWNDNTGNLLAFASSYGNYGYFALPAAIALFGKESEAIIIVAGIGFTVYSCTVGYFVTALGNFTVRKSLIKTISLPSVYAMILGLTFNAMGWKIGSFMELNLNSVYLDVARDIRGAYSVFGMMLVGIAIAEIKHFIIDWKFLGMAMLAQFIIWPLIIGGIILLDKNIFGFYPVLILKIIFLLSLIPIGANLIAYSTQLNVQPEKASITILITTVFAMLYVPFMVSLFIGLI